MRKFSASLAASLGVLCLTWLSALAAPPVRMAIVPGGGSGMEQEICDRITSDLQSNKDVIVSTVNPEWFVQANVVDKTDIAGANVRVNGTVIIKTADGQVLDTISMQTNKQDFSLQPGTPVNKRLADNAVREVVAGLVERVRQPLANAVEREIDTRDKIIKAQQLGDEDKYDEAIQLLMGITPDTPHFKGVRSLIAEFQMEKDALTLVTEAQKLAKAGRYRQAIEMLKEVDPHSKRAKLAKTLSDKYRAALARRTVRKPAPAKKPATPPSSATDAQLKALDAQKRALDAQKRAVEAQEAAIKSKQK